MPMDAPVCQQVGQTIRLLFLFIDVVAYSKEPDGRQLTIITNLQEFVRRSALFQLMEKHGAPWQKTILLPTGDGMAFCFSESTLFEHPENLLTFTDYLRTQAAAHKIEIRFGLHAEDGQIYSDVNDQPNVAGNGINIAARVMSQADGGQILASGAFYSVIFAKCGQEKAQMLFRALGKVEVKHGISLDLYSYQHPGTPANLSRRPSKQSERLIAVQRIVLQLRRIEEKWHTILAAKKEEKGTAAEKLNVDPKLRVTLLYRGQSLARPDKQALFVSTFRYSRMEAWSHDGPPSVIFEENQGPSTALGQPREGPAVAPITGLPDPGGGTASKLPRSKHASTSPSQEPSEDYVKDLQKKSGTPPDVIRQLRRHARSFMYVPFAFDSNGPWDGVIAVDSARPLASFGEIYPTIWIELLESIKMELEAIGYLWKLVKRI